MLPTIMVSARAMSDIVRASTWADDYLTKPFALM
jgi:DNA-binding response OmpR family regulator